MIRAAPAFWLALSLDAAASDTALYPAAQCAAFWLGRQDYALTGGWLQPDPLAMDRAAAFRAAALRLAPDRADEIDARIADQRLPMQRLHEAAIDWADPDSIDLLQDLTLTCGRFAETAPELNGLR